MRVLKLVVVALITVALNGCPSMYGNRNGGGVGVKIGLPILPESAQTSDKPLAGHP